MSIEELWNEALKKTEISRLPMKRLLTFGVSKFDYIFLAPSLVNEGDTVVRTGRMDIDQPMLVLPKHMPQFDGFSSDDGRGIKDAQLASFFYMRGLSLPALQYNNEQTTVDVFEGALAKAEKMYIEQIRNQENISTGIVIGANSSWQFSIILLACYMVDSHVDADVKALLEKIKRK